MDLRAGLILNTFNPDYVQFIELKLILTIYFLIFFDLLISKNIKKVFILHIVSSIY
jgi:hypothetical protein